MAENLSLAAIENDDDLLLLSFSRQEESVISYQRLDIEKLTNDLTGMISKFFATHFRFLNCFFYENRTTATNIEGLCIVLRRLAYPSRLDDLEPVFGRSKAEIYYIFNYVLDFLYTMHSHLFV